MIDLVFQNSTDDCNFNKSLFEKITAETIRHLELENNDIGVSINLVEEDKIKELNKKYRNKDKVTDVLSFPMQ